VHYARQALEQTGAAETPMAPELAFRTVLSGIDGSPEGLEAARQALALGADGAVYWGLAAWDPRLAFHARLRAPGFTQSLRDESRAALRAAHEAIPELRPMLISGRDVASLLAGIANLQADLVCVGSHGTSRAAGVLFGSVASAMAHFAPCSVLVARTPRSESFPGPLLHANDGSPESLDAARVAGVLAARYDAAVATLYVGEAPDRGVAEDAVAIIESCGTEPMIRVEEGSPHRRIVEVANETDAGLIVMGSRGRTGVAALGSVSERVTHRAGCSVLLVRRSSHPVEDDAESS
jgi:nucleotide-binding universal stress UspA family protein